MNRIYSDLEIKELSSDSRSFTGIASTMGTDRMGDEVMADGVVYKTPLPLLWQHDHNQPIGSVNTVKSEGGEVSIEAEVSTVSESGRLKDRIDEAWQSIKSGLVRGLSVGFKIIDAEPTARGLKIKAWELLEVSAVTVPANRDASIQAIKSLCAPDYENLGEHVSGGYKLLAIERPSMENPDGSFTIRARLDP